MPDTGSVLLIAVPAGLASAAAIGLANTSQARATQQVASRRILDPRLFYSLVRNPTWIVGTLGTVVGLILQVTALGFGPLLLVQPLLVTSLLFTTLFLARSLHRRIDTTITVGALLCTVGLALFLLVARPGDSGDSMVPIPQVLPLAIVFLVVVAVCVGFAFVANSDARVLALALTTGVFYGVTAGMMKVVSGQLREGIVQPFTHWQLYVVCVIGPMGFLLSQNTFQQGILLAPAVALITAVDPLVGVVIGIGWFGETLHTDGGSLAGEVIAGLMLLGGIAVLARRSERLKEQTAKAVRRGTRTSPAGG